jgi:ribosomal protein L37E
MNKTGRKCIECGHETYAIQVIDRGQQNIHYDLVYAAAESKSKSGKGHEVVGKINAESCNNCGRVTLPGALND